MAKVVYIKYHPGIQKLRKTDVGDWIDLCAGEEIFIPVGQSRIIPLGVEMKLPEGCEAIIAPRSSTFMRYGIFLVNGIGIIDNSYCGNHDTWQFPAYCLEARTIVDGRPGTLIRKNDRIAQFRILANQPVIHFVEVSELEDEDRGGFGSTGW